MEQHHMKDSDIKPVLVIYSTVDGHTHRICNYICNQINKEHEVSMHALKDAMDIDLKQYGAIIIGASIRYGKHRPSLYKFINKNVHNLNNMPNAFFSVNVVARKDNKNTAGTNPYIKTFLKKSPWSPQYIDVFAGKIDFPNYGFFDKYIIRFIMWLTKGPSDITKTYEFTDWKIVDKFVNNLSKKNILPPNKK